MTGQQRTRMRPRRPLAQPVWTSRHEAELQQALEDGTERSNRTWQGRRYGAGR